MLVYFTRNLLWGTSTCCIWLFSNSAHTQNYGYERSPVGGLSFRLAMKHPCLWLQTQPTKINCHGVYRWSQKSVSLWVSLSLNCAGVEVSFPRAFPLLLQETLFKRTRSRRQGKPHSSILYLLQISLIRTVPFPSEPRLSFSTKYFQWLLIYD